MDRMFGKAKPAAPKATLQDAHDSMEKRGEGIDTKIMKLDKELGRYTEQLKKMKPGPAKATVQKRAMAILKQKKMYEGQKEQTMNQQFNMDQVMFAQACVLFGGGGWAGEGEIGGCASAPPMLLRSIGALAPLCRT